MYKSTTGYSMVTSQLFCGNFSFRTTAILSLSDREPGRWSQQISTQRGFAFSNRPNSLRLLSARSGLTADGWSLLSSPLDSWLEALPPWQQTQPLAISTLEEINVLKTVRGFLMQYWHFLWRRRHSSVPLNYLMRPFLTLQLTVPTVGLVIWRTRCWAR